MWKDKKGNTRKGKKIKEHAEVWGDYYYMTSSQCSVTEIAAILQEQGVANLEVWPEMGILEWPTAQDRWIDVERLERFSNVEDGLFLKTHNIQCIFSLHISSLDEDTFLMFFDAVLKQFSGVVCCDTEQFEPIVMGTF